MDQKNLPNQCLWILRFEVSEPRCAWVESAVSAKARAYSPLAAFGLASIHSDWSSALAIRKIAREASPSSTRGGAIGCGL